MIDNGLLRYYRMNTALTGWEDHLIDLIKWSRKMHFVDLEHVRLLNPVNNFFTYQFHPNKLIDYCRTFINCM